jgi:hypothetical protein
MASNLGFSAEVILSRFKALNGLSAGSKIPKTVFLSFVGDPAGIAKGIEQLKADGLVEASESDITITEAGVSRIAAH